MDRTAIRARYLRDPIPTRLGGLAANLARIRSFSAHDANGQVVESLLEESKYFIEWTASEVEIEVAAELVELQLLLASWQWNWSQLWPDAEKRMEVARQSQLWANRVLELSGLLKSTVR